jgi:hypothetical protein
MVSKMLDAFKDLGCNMSLELHFLHSHLDYSPENLGSLSEEKAEMFHKDIKEIERRYQGRWCINMLAYYFGCLSKRFHKVHTEAREQEELSQQKSNDYSDRNDCSTLLQ